MTCIMLHMGLKAKHVILQSTHLFILTVINWHS
jgi:hypothetical protein